MWDPQDAKALITFISRDEAIEHARRELEQSGSSGDAIAIRCLANGELTWAAAVNQSDSVLFITKPNGVLTLTTEREVFLPSSSVILGDVNIAPESVGFSSGLQSFDIFAYHNPTAAKAATEFFCFTCLEEGFSLGNHPEPQEPMRLSGPNGTTLYVPAVIHRGGSANDDFRSLRFDRKRVKFDKNSPQVVGSDLRLADPNGNGGGNGTSPVPKAEVTLNPGFSWAGG
jgi:hypothetical protein